MERDVDTQAARETRRPDTAGTIELPPELAGQLRTFEKRLRFMETLVACFGGLCGVLLTYLFLFVSDRFWNTPGWLRVVLTCAGGVTLALFSSRWMRHWLWHRRNSRDLARIVQRKYNRLGDRLLGAVELAGGEAGSGQGSPALRRAAIRQVAAEAHKYDFRGAVEARRPRLYSLVFAILTVLVSVPFILFPRAGVNTLARWFNPLSSVERYTFVRLEDLPSEKIVPHGEAFEIACELSRQSVWRPTKGVCRIEGQPDIEARIDGGLAVFSVPGQVRPEVLAIRIGDVTRRMRVVPLYRPELLRLDATVTLPAYLSREPREQRVEGSTLELLKGSTVALKGVVNRDLSAATIATPATQALAVADATFRTDTLGADQLSSCQLSWSDRHDLSCAAPYLLEMLAVDDAPSTVRCRGLGRAVAILEDETVNLRIASSDDYGVKRSWVEWHGEAKPELGVAARTETVDIGEGGPTATEVTGEFTFSPITMHVPEETTVRIKALSRDYFPERKPTESPEFQVYVLSRARHAQLIQDQMQNLQARLEDLAREEEKQIQKNTDIASRDEDSLKSKRTTDELRESVQNENRNRQQLSQMARDAQKLTKEAMRNKDIGEQTVRDWSEMSQKMSQVSSGDMRQAAQSLQQARQSEQQRSEDVNQGVEAEKRALAAMREMESGINDSVEQMVAQSFVNRLKKAAGVEDDVADSLKTLLPRVIGLNTNELPADARQKLVALAGGQTDNKTQVAYIRDDLAGFYNRTRLDVYKTIHGKILDSGVVPALGKLAENVARNVGANSIAEARDWANQLREWAELLQEKGIGGGGSGGSGGTPEQVDIEVLIALMRARMQEESLRDQTRLLDQSKLGNKRYTQDARKLSETQYDVAKDVRPLERKVSSPQARKLIEQVGGEMMNAGMYLRRPQTDTGTLGIETVVIELLANAIQATSGQSSAAVQSLMQSAGLTGGGSTAGGVTDAANRDMAGAANGDPSEKRRVEKASAADRSAWPEEFRDALEGYFRALEREEE